MKMHEQFSGYLSSSAQDAALAYLNGRVFPEMNRLAERTSHARNAYHILAGIAVVIMLLIPILLLGPDSLPDALVNLVVCALGFIQTGIVFAIVLLRLPQRAAEGKLRTRLLTGLVHAYFLRTEVFADEEDEKCLKLLYAEAEKLL